MSDTKIQLKFGGLEFSGEGDKEWLGVQLDKIFAKITNVELKKADDQPEEGFGNKTTIKKITNLALFLKEKNASTVQTKKFLATAAFLQVNGKTRMTTADISKSLKDSNQTKLNNPSDCLNQNVSKGFCEKDGEKGFFVTDPGFADIGIKI